MQKTLVFIGVFFLLMGFLWPLLSKLPFGRLPGDILISRPDFKIYFPITTMLIVSIVLSFILRLFRRYVR